MITVCWAAKGGSGTTVVAAAMAIAATTPTLLIDLAGDVPAVLGIPEPDGPGVFDWLRRKRRRRVSRRSRCAPMGTPACSRAAVLRRCRRRDGTSSPRGCVVSAATSWSTPGRRAPATGDRPRRRPRTARHPPVLPRAPRSCAAIRRDRAAWCWSKSPARAASSRTSRPASACLSSPPCCSTRRSPAPWTPGCCWPDCRPGSATPSGSPHDAAGRR